MSLTALLEQGAPPADEVLDESGAKISSCKIDAKRDYIYKKDGATRQVVYMRGENPRLEGSLEFEPIRASGALAGFAILHPGVAMTSANIAAAATINGFLLPTGAKIIIKDVTTTKTDTVEDKISVPWEYWPGIAVASYSSAAS
jgi:hypothetical protein